MGFGHVCHLFRASLPFSGHQLKPGQLSWQLWRVGRAGKKGEGMQLPQEPQEHYIQSTLNAAWRLNAADWCCLSLEESQQPQPCWPPLIALPFVPTQQHKLVAPQPCRDSCSCNSCSTGLQHRSQQHWGWYCNRFPGGNGTHPPALPPAKLLPYIMGYKQVSTLIQKAPWVIPA